MYQNQLHSSSIGATDRADSHRDNFDAAEVAELSKLAARSAYDDTIRSGFIEIVLRENSRAVMRVVEVDEKLREVIVKIDEMARQCDVNSLRLMKAALQIRKTVRCRMQEASEMPESESVAPYSHLVSVSMQAAELLGSIAVPSCQSTLDEISHIHNERKAAERALQSSRDNLVRLEREIEESFSRVAASDATLEEFEVQSRDGKGDSRVEARLRAAVKHEREVYERRCKKRDKLASNVNEQKDRCQETLSSTARLVEVKVDALARALTEVSPVIAAIKFEGEKVSEGWAGLLDSSASVDADHEASRVRREILEERLIRSILENPYHLAHREPQLTVGELRSLAREALSPNPSKEIKPMFRFFEQGIGKSVKEGLAEQGMQLPPAELKRTLQDHARRVLQLAKAGTFKGQNLLNAHKKALYVAAVMFAVESRKLE